MTAPQCQARPTGYDNRCVWCQAQPLVLCRCDRTQLQEAVWGRGASPARARLDADRVLGQALARRVRAVVGPDGDVHAALAWIEDATAFNQVRPGERRDPLADAVLSLTAAQRVWFDAALRR